MKTSNIANKIETENISFAKSIAVYIFLLAALIILMLAPMASAEDPVQMASIKGFGASTFQNEIIASDDDKPEGIDAATCKTFGKIQASVDGPTELEFWWKGSDTGILTFYVNGKAESIMTENKGWQLLKFSVKDGGPHFLSWEYKGQDKV
jgi:hypothetical protein